MSSSNGYTLCGYVLPETVLEGILSKLPVSDILHCNLVCRAWKDTITRKSFWKKCYDREGLNWDSVPVHIREKSDGWAVLCIQLCRGPFTRNLISNPSGHLQFESWTITKNGGDLWKVENPPLGCDPLPEDSSYPTDDDFCFVTSFYPCSKTTVIDLWSFGLNPEIMKICLPLEIRCSQMYTARFDCGGIFRWDLKILDSDRNAIQMHNANFSLPATMDWEKAEHSFKFESSGEDVLKDVRYLEFTHEGSDTQFWKGHYGMKFARATVSIKILHHN